MTDHHLFPIISMQSSTTANNLRPSRSPMSDDELFFSLSRELKPSTSAKVGKAPYASTFLGKAGSIGLEVLDTLGSSLTELLSNRNGKFESNPDSKGSKVSMLAFEVANTIVKGSNLMQSITYESIQNFKTEIFLTEGVQLLVSTDVKELLRIAAADKREEFEIFSREVARFGDLCVDWSWHNLDRFFRLDMYSVKNERLREEAEVKNKRLREEAEVKNERLREEAEVSMQELANLALRTAELYHEWHALDRLEQVYQCKLEDVESSGLPQKGESLLILQSERKHQKKLVRNLLKKSLWSKSLEEIVEKLVDVVSFINHEFAEAFDVNAADLNDEMDKKTERLGLSGLSLHYANIITQIDNIASHPTSLHPKMRDKLYKSLPVSVRPCLRCRLRSFDFKEMMTVSEIKSEMDKTLQWIVPLATNTTKAHQSFGWFGEWANTGFEFGKKTAVSNNINRLQTLYHADKNKMDQYILDLIILLHRLIYRANGQPQRVKISLEDKYLLVPGVSKSQDFEKK